MKKIIFILSLFLGFGFQSKAGLAIVNHTSYTIYFTIFCHDNSYSSCEYYQSAQLFEVPPSDDLIPYWSNTDQLGSCYSLDNYYTTPTYLPGSSQNWDVVKFTVGGSSIAGSVGLCGTGVSTTFSSGSFSANWTGSGGNYYVTFS